MRECNECMAECRPEKSELISNEHCEKAITRRTIPFKEAISKFTISLNTDGRLIKAFLDHA